VTIQAINRQGEATGAVHRAHGRFSCTLPLIGQDGTEEALASSPLGKHANSAGGLLDDNGYDLTRATVDMEAATSEA